MRSIVFTVVSFATLVFAPSLMAQQTPEDFLAAIYDGPEGQPDVGIVEPERRADYFTAEVVDLMAKAEEVNLRLYQIEGLDVNPVVPGQDYDVSEVTVEPARVEGDRAVAEVRFLNFGEPERLVYQLVRDGGQWRISDVSWQDSTFQEDLRAAAQE